MEPSFFTFLFTLPNYGRKACQLPGLDSRQPQFYPLK
ncbi:hypothetical protein A2U01_0038757, partial [Trifolium medium]|nr:hypothetical protein [Trifolium medium]